MTKVFVSYSHKQGAWVWQCLVPCLDAGGADVLIDRDRFEYGKGVIGQMDDTQDAADLQLLLLSRAYLRSKYCRHEMNRAIEADPTFSSGRLIPVITEEVRFPQQMTRHEPLCLDFRDYSEHRPWLELAKACRIDLGAPPRHWLDVLEELVQCLLRRESVNLRVIGKANWRGLLRCAKKFWIPQFVEVDLDDPSTIECEGLLRRIMEALGVGGASHSAPWDLASFSEVIKSSETRFVALKHFSHVIHRDYGNDLFRTLRHLIKDARKLVLVTQSRVFTDYALTQDPATDSPLVEDVLELKGFP